MLKPGFPGDPIKAYGQRAAEMLLAGARRVPAAYRDVALNAVLHEVEPGLADRVKRRQAAYRARGMAPRRAQRNAIASSMSEGLMRELVKLGRGQKPAMRSQLGLGYYGEQAEQLALAGLWSSIKSGVSKVGSAIKSGAEAVVGGVKKGASAAWNFGSNAVSKLGILACGVVNNPAAQVAAGAGGAAIGGPAGAQAGAQGAAIGAQLCSKNDVPPASTTALMAPTRTTPKWVWPAAIAGAGVIAILLLRK